LTVTPTGVMAIVQAPETVLPPTFTRPPGTATSTPGTLRGVVDPRDIAMRPSVNGQNGNGSAVLAPTPTLPGVRGIPAAEPREPVAMPPVPPREIPGAEPRATGIASAADVSPPAIALDPRVNITPVFPPPSGFEPPRGPDLRATPSRPDEPRMVQPDREPDVLAGPRLPFDPRTDPRPFGGPPGGFPIAPGPGGAPPVGPGSSGQVSPPQVPSAAGSAPAAAPAAAPASSALAPSAAVAAGPMAPTSVTQPSPTTTRSPTPTTAPPTVPPTPTATIPVSSRGGMVPPSDGIGVAPPVVTAGLGSPPMMTTPRPLVPQP
jgi:hypothetical protein